MLKPKLLLISGLSPFPQVSGGATRIKNTLLQLSKKYDIYFYFFVDQNYSFTKKESIFFSKYTKFFKPISLNEKSLTTSIGHLIPYHLSNYFNDNLIQDILEIQRKYKFEKIRVETTQLLYLAKYLNQKIETEFVTYDVSSVSFWRRALETKNPVSFLIRLVSFIQVFFYEKSNLKEFSKNIAVSNHDCNLLKKLYRLNRIEVSFNGIEDINLLSIRAGKTIKFGFIGSISHTPNIKAIDFLMNDIAKELDKDKIDYQLIILGKNNYKSSNKKIRFIEYFDNLKDFYGKVDFLVAPIFSGSGSRIKILESLSFGRPVITSVIGAEGIDLDSNYLTIISKNKINNPTEWKNLILLQKNKILTSNDQEKLINNLRKLTWKETIF